MPAISHIDNKKVPALSPMDYQYATEGLTRAGEAIHISSK